MFKYLYCAAIQLQYTTELNTCWYLFLVSNVALTAPVEIDICFFFCFLALWTAVSHSIVRLELQLC